MSTRSQILFRRSHSWEDDDGKTQERTEEVLTYKHHDGYPRSTIPLLREYFDYAKFRASDIEYFVASFCYWYKRKRERWMRERDNGDMELLENKDGADESVEDFSPPSVLTGMGVCATDYLKGDVEHLYVVDLNDREIEHYRPSWPEDTTANEYISDREPVDVYELNAPEKQNIGGE